MRAAFYAPLKPPGHPVPSGDRAMARGLMAAIAFGGRAEVILASDLRSRDGAGDAASQARIARDAAAEADRLVRDLPASTRLWVTYHNYYKAPDLIGPVVAARRGLRYVIVEASRARSRLTGPWAGFARAAEAASDAADIIFHPTEHDRVTLERDRRPGQRLHRLPPFLPVEALPPEGVPVPGRLLAVGMMRPGDKLASYALLAEALEQVLHPDWHLHVAGDGPARAEVAALLARFGKRVTLFGQLDRAALDTAYRHADLMVWPGVNEAFGMVFLEAQAGGVPVVAQDRPGVRDVLAGGFHPAVEAGAAGLAARIDALLADRGLRADAATQARARIAADHLLPAAAARFWSAVGPLVGAPA